jgi:hypothetical protein
MNAFSMILAFLHSASRPAAAARVSDVPSKVAIGKRGAIAEDSLEVQVWRLDQAAAMLRAHGVHSVVANDPEPSGVDDLLRNLCRH